MNWFNSYRKLLTDKNKRQFIIGLCLSLFCCAPENILGAQPFSKAKLKYDLQFILDEMLLLKNLPKKSSIPLPKVYFESETPLEFFQDAIKDQWKMTPKVFSNAFAVKMNAIFLIDDDTYYKKYQRCMDDSLAHELVHYIQAKYQNIDLNDEFIEFEAIDYQNQFREKFCPM